VGDGEWASVIDPLLIDLYPRDHVVDWPTYMTAGPPWHGAFFKLTQGLDYEYSGWAHAQRAHLFASKRYGDDLFDGFYHFLTLDQDGAVQAERFWLYLTKVGGERAGTLPAMVDVERGGQRHRVVPTRTGVEHITGAFALRYRQLSGKLATLYGGELLRSLGIADRIGCGRSAVALYGPELHGAGESTAQFLARTGTDLAHTMLWQYTAAEGAATGPTGYPREAPGVGRVDINAVILPGGLQAMRALL
jgi:hypothetical protein